MQTFLPSGYSFSPDKLINQSKYQSLINSIQKNEQMARLFSFLTLISLLIIAIMTIIFKMKKSDKIVIFGKTIYTWEIISISLIIPVILIFFSTTSTINSKIDEMYNRPSVYYKTAYFKYPVKSNLNVCMLDGNNQPKNANDHKKYPYEIRLKNPKKYQFDVDGPTMAVSGHYEFKTNKPIHIGKMQDNKFIPANNHLAGIFNKYYTYIIKHNLGDKFADTMMFKPNSNYLTINGDVQWVLSNDKDLVLYLHDGSTVTESKIAKD